MIMSNSGDGSSSSSMDHHHHLSQIVSGGVHHQLHHHHHHQGGVRGLKKGPWTAAEDSILMEYVKKHGEGNWNAVQKNAGLARYGKSCRLRWANHLRPNLKKGSLTAGEERILIELHAKYGNKWARLASQLPGRTDNEIKNYWNTRMKRCQRAGLPIYPHDLQHNGAAAAASTFHHHQPHHHHHNSNSSLSSLISSHHPRKANYTSLYNRISFDTPLHQNHTSLGYSSSRFNGNGCFAIPPSPVSSFGTSSNSGLFNQAPLPNNQTLMSSTPPPSHQYFNNSSGFGSYNSLNLTSMIMGAPNAYESLNPELPSSQTTPPYSPYTKGEGLMEDAVDDGYTDNGYEIKAVSSPGKRGSGLLDDVLVQASALSRKRSRSGEESESGKEKGNADNDTGESGGEGEGEEENVQEETTWKSSGENSGENLRDGSSSPSVGMKPNENPLEDMEDDLLSLLNFQSTAPAVSDSWYVGSVS